LVKSILYFDVIILSIMGWVARGFAMRSLEYKVRERNYLVLVTSNQQLPLTVALDIISIRKQRNVKVGTAKVIKPL